jgi:hypothetical protein
MHIGELPSGEVGHKGIAECLVKVVQRWQIQLFLESSRNQFTESVSQARHPFRQIFWCAHGLSLVSQKIIQESC